LEKKSNTPIQSNLLARLTRNMVSLLTLFFLIG